MNFILSSQDTSDQTAIMACMVDFSKAFDRQNHNILRTKLSDMGVPGWLLKIVMAFFEKANNQASNHFQVGVLGDTFGPPAVYHSDR